MKLLFPLFIIISVFVFSCKKEKKQEEESVFNRSNMLQSIINQSIFPANDSFMVKAHDLYQAIHSYSGNLAQLKSTWTQAANSWKACELYNYPFIKIRNLHNSIGKWPINKAFVNNYLTDTIYYTNSKIENLGSTSKGIFTLEYILFHHTATDSLLNDTITKSYIASLAQNIYLKSDLLRDVWLANEQNFIANTQNSLNGSINQLINNQVALLETIVHKKLGKPMGKSTPGNTIDCNLLEAQYAETSLEHIQHNLQSIYSAYNNGINDLLDHVEATHHGTPLTIEINNKFTQCFSLLNNQNNSLKWLLTNDIQYLNNLYNTLNSLLTLFKVDVSSNLSIIITFNDNDGD